MIETESIFRMVIKLYIIINAIRLGWRVKIYNNKIILSKCSDNLTTLDKNTPTLINALIHNIWS